MRTTKRLPVMSIRAWLGVALAVLFLAPVLTTMVIGIIVFAPTHGPREIDQEIGDLVVRDASRWTDPAWQEELRLRYADQGADVVLLVDGREIFRTGEPLPHDGSRTVRKVTVPGANPPQEAHIYADIIVGPPLELRQWFVPVALVAALVLALAGIAWFLRRAIIQPLESTSEAARRVARGEMNVRLPSSQVREVAELNRAFESMSDDLQASLERRTAMEKERRLFITAIAHDLRTPLFSLRGSLEGLRTGVAASPEQRERYLRIASEKADQLEHLIADLFTYTRIEYMGETPSLATLDLAGLLREIVDGAAPRAEDQHVTLLLDGTDGSVPMEADEHLLTRAVENIIDNALRYTPEGGRIRVALAADGTGAIITITDSGPGFGEPDIPLLFEPLYRAESSRNRKTGGAGLGLTIAHRIITAHGGTLLARNGASGGAELQITLPLE